MTSLYDEALSEVQIKLEVYYRDELVYKSEFYSVDDLEESGLRKAEHAIEDASEASKERERIEEENYDQFKHGDD